jgi:opacity protein-like surface antigen
MTGMSRTAFLTTVYIFFVMMSATASAADPLGLYLGASVGISHVRTEDDKVNCCDVWRFDDSHTGWKVYGGVRPLSFVGVEAVYTDFGHTSAPPPSNFIGFFNENSRQSAASIFGVGYLPLPLPYLDVYGKVGVARLNTEVQVTTRPFTCPVGGSCGPNIVREDQRSTNLTYGAGVQAKLGSFSLRAEYERINASDGDPDLFSVGIIWRF